MQRMCDVYKYIYVHTSYVYRGECVCVCVRRAYLWRMMDPCVTAMDAAELTHFPKCLARFLSLLCVYVCVCVSLDTASLDVHIHSRGEHFLAWNSSLYISLVHYIQI